jgi:hypothetical protein
MATVAERRVCVHIRKPPLPRLRVPRANGRRQPPRLGSLSGISFQYSGHDVRACARLVVRLGQLPQAGPRAPTLELATNPRVTEPGPYQHLGNGFAQVLPPTTQHCSWTGSRAQDKRARSNRPRIRPPWRWGRERLPVYVGPEEAVGLRSSASPPRIVPAGRRSPVGYLSSSAIAFDGAPMHCWLWRSSGSKRAACAPTWRVVPQSGRHRNP